jgi:hypothetical protein
MQFSYYYLAAALVMAFVPDGKFCIDAVLSVYARRSLVTDANTARVLDRSFSQATRKGD